ncbi:unnamed protein product, partial [Urochloa humidicola]
VDTAQPNYDHPFALLPDARSRLRPRRPNPPHVPSVPAGNRPPPSPATRSPRDGEEPLRLHPASCPLLSLAPNS